MVLVWKWYYYPEIDQRRHVLVNPNDPSSAQLRRAERTTAEWIARQPDVTRQAFELWVDRGPEAGLEETEPEAPEVHPITGARRREQVELPPDAVVVEPPQRPRVFRIHPYLWYRGRRAREDRAIAEREAERELLDQAIGGEPARDESAELKKTVDAHCDRFQD